jgi:prophage maintenance system killer protein
MVHDELVSGLFSGAEPVGRDEFRDRRLLESAAWRPFQSAGGVEIYDTLEKKAAALFHSLIANHPFHNGNKRTAILALDHFLLVNGLFLMATPESMYKMASATAVYRERGISHEDMFVGITRILRLGCCPMRELKGKSRFANELYAEAVRTRREIRSSPLNRQQPGSN